MVRDHRLPNYLPIDDQRGLIRDTKTRAIINIRKDEYESKKIIRERKLQEQKRLNILENDMKEIKELLQKLVNNL